MAAVNGVRPTKDLLNDTAVRERLITKRDR